MKKTQGKSIIFLGDSITEGVGASTIEKRWTDLVTKEGEFSIGYNFGVAGTRIAVQMNEHNLAWAESFCQRLERLPKSTDYVLVFGGTNDYGHGDAPLGKIGDTTPQTFYGAMDTLLRSLMEKYPTAKIAVLTPLQRTMENRLFNEVGIRNCGTLCDYVNAEKAVCQKYAIPVLDLYATSGICPDNKVNKETYTTDGLNPNDNGHRLLADIILRFVQTAL